MKKKQLEKLFNDWVKKTGRNGGVLIGSSIKEFFQYVEENSVQITEQQISNVDIIFDLAAKITNHGRRRFTISKGVSR